MLAINASCVESPGLSHARQKLTDSLKPDEAPGLIKSLMASLDNIDLGAPHGVYLGQTSIYRFEPQRIQNVIRRVVRGLYYHETRRALAPAASVWVGAIRGFPATGEEFQMIADLIPSSTVVFSRGGFSYRKLIHSDGVNSAWLLEFYGGVAFLARTSPGH